MFERGDAATLHGEISQVANWVSHGQRDALLGYFNTLLARDSWQIEHPLQAGVQVVCRASVRLRFGNVLFFNNDASTTPFALIQTGDFVNGLLVENTVYQLHQNAFGVQAVENIAFDLLRYPEYQAYYTQNCAFGGVLVSHQRPAHYFYDQLVHLPMLNIPTDKAVATDEHCFYPPSHIIKRHTEPAAENHFYLFPNLLAGGLGVGELLEAKIAEAAQPVDELANADFVLWIGVADEKRCWLDQVNGYANLINELDQHFKNLAVVVDGFTALHRKILTVESDEAILAAIKAKLASGVAVYSVIGRDYETKVNYASGVNGFVTYIGTQAMVPLNFVKCSGVLHSNTVYGSGQQFDEDRRVTKIPLKHITDQPNPTSEKSDFTSYFFHWQLAYNQLLEVTGLALDKLPVPQPRLAEDLPPLELTDVTLFETLPSRVEPFKQSPDLLREIAFLFEAAGNICVAERIMAQAKALRPEGKVLVAKLDAYRARLQSDAAVAHARFTEPTEQAMSQFLGYKHRVAPYHRAADYLRELALLFESINDVTTAEQIMAQAVAQRPQGKVLTRKLAAYQKKLRNEGMQ